MKANSTRPDIGAATAIQSADLDAESPAGIGEVVAASTVRDDMSRGDLAAVLDALLNMTEAK